MSIISEEYVLNSLLIGYAVSIGCKPDRWVFVANDKDSKVYIDAVVVEAEPFNLYKMFSSMSYWVNIELGEVRRKAMNGFAKQDIVNEYNGG